MMGRFAAHLEACDPARNLRRAYTLEAGRDLFGAWLVAVAFGRIGRPGRRLVYVLATEAEACRMVRARLRRRASAPRRLGVAYELRRLTDPDGWSDGLVTAPGGAQARTSSGWRPPHSTQPSRARSAGMSRSP
jgi:predicted DNA-binding WGR domain protein